MNLAAIYEVSITLKFLRCQNVIFLLQSYFVVCFAKVLSTYRPLESKIIPFSCKCTTEDPSAQGNEIFLISLKAYILLLFMNVE